jgi:hypothetical protein
MRTTTTALIAAVAILALSALTSTAASAAEVLFKSGAIGATFTSSGGKAAFSSGGGIALTCEAVHNNGKVTDQHLGEVTITFLKCKESFGGECTLGAVKGDITIEKWSGILG